MAKKTTKTTTKNTKKGTVTKTVTKSSKKGLIIGIVVGALALAGAGVGGYFIWKHFNEGGGNKPGEVKFSLSSDYPTKVEGKAATVYVDWTPNDKIRFESFTFTADPVKKNTVTFDQTGDPRPMPVTITFNEEITEDLNGTLSFTYDDVTTKVKGRESKINVNIPKPEPPKPEKKATLKLSSTIYGTFTDGATELDISDYIGQSEFKVDFVPGDDYVGRDFTIGVIGATGFTGTYSSTNEEITISGATLQDKDELTITLTLVELWTASLDPTSQTFGNLTDGDEQTGASITIEDYIGESEAEISFTPEYAYISARFTVTASDTRGSTLTAEYTGGQSPTIKITSDDVFKDGDEVTLHLVLKTWTASLDDDSKAFGGLTLDGETKADSIDMYRYIGQSYAIVMFLPDETYEETQFVITATDKDGNELTANYTLNPPGTTCNISLEYPDGETRFKADDVITLHFELPYTLTYHYQDGVTEDYVETYAASQPTVEPTKPTREGYVFGDWFTSSYQTDNTLFTFGSALTANTEIWAHWYKELTINYVNELYTTTPSKMHFFNYLVTDRRYYDLTPGSTAITIDDSASVLDVKFKDGDEAWPEYDFYPYIEVTVQNPDSDPTTLSPGDYQFQRFGGDVDLNFTVQGDNKIKTGATLTIHIKNPT